MTTLIIGASNNPERYSYKATHSLINNGHEVVLFGVKRGSAAGIEIQNNWDSNWNIDTVTMYINAKLQVQYYDKILALQPRRVIFNPGTDNPEFEQLIQAKNIEFENACTLVMLSVGNY